MTAPLDALARDLLGRAAAGTRYMVAIAGAPGAGKSTLAEALHARCEAEAPGWAALVPMDGFHLDNAVLEARGLRARKGAPQTFDAAGLACALERIRQSREPVAVPTFDRALDLARAGARIVAPEQALVLVEGNYLLIEDAPWAALGALFDATIFLDVPEPELRRRLIARWLRHGLDPAAAERRAETNDLPNARLVMARSRPADLVWRGDAALPEARSR